MGSYYPSPKNYGIMLGSNDAHTGISATTAANNVKTMYYWAVANGSNAVILIPPMCSDTGGYRGLEYSKQWLVDFENNLTGYKYIKVYDATDQNSTNGVPDAINESMFETDGLHLNELGQAATGNYIWTQLRGDYSSNAVSGVVPLKVRVTYANAMFPANSMRCDFNNDSTIDSNATNPVYTYGAAGTYTVNLTVNNTYGNFSNVKTDYITVTAPTAPSTIDEMWAILSHFFFGVAMEAA